MLPKAHLTSHSGISGSRWMITPSWLSGSWRSFLYSSSVYSCYLFLIPYASVRSLPFLFFIEPIFTWNVPLVFLIFLKRSLVFPILLFSSISLHWSLRKAFLSLLAILWNSTFKWVYLSFSPLLFTFLLFTAICKASSEAVLLFCISFSWGWSWSLSPVQCHEPPCIMTILIIKSYFYSIETNNYFFKEELPTPGDWEGNTEIHKCPKLSTVYLQSPLGQILTMYKHYLQFFLSCHGQLLKALILIRVCIMPRR